LAVYERNGTEYLVGIIPVSLEENNNQLTTRYSGEEKADGDVIEEAVKDPTTNKPYHF
jgi:hypothetical protein